MTHVEAQVGNADWLFGVAAVMTTIPGIVAAIAGLKANRKAREAKEAVAEVRETANATHAVVVEKLEENGSVVETLQAISAEARTRQAIVEDYIEWRKTHE